MKYILFIWIAKIVFVLSKTFGKGSGTAMPGLILERYVPDIMKYFAKQIPYIIVITGTNGKTSTQKILKTIFEYNCKKVIANTSGSNMSRGLLSTFVINCNMFGKLKYDYGIFEIEEATLPLIINKINPNQLIVTNLFRDQLDAYGEINRTQDFIISALKKSPSTVAILNADDPKIKFLTKNLSNNTMYFGIDKNYLQSFKYEGDNIELANDISVYRATNIKILDNLGSSFFIANQEFVINIPGIFQVYNCVSAILSAKLCRLFDKHIVPAIANVNPAFGRGETINKDNINYKLLLVKNPAGLNLSLELLKSINNSKIVFLLNDNTADGKDVSWIWDGNYELLNKIKPNLIIAGGSRANDMLLRIKYALPDLQKSQNNNYYSQTIGTTVIIESEFEKLHKSLTTMNNIDYVYVLTTYTAMLEFRKFISGNAIPN
jgi:lipid II isoglutaminyl synthase (glutamine-hydrolysing)